MITNQEPRDLKGLFMLALQGEENPDPRLKAAAIKDVQYVERGRQELLKKGDGVERRIGQYAHCWDHGTAQRAEASRQAIETICQDPNHHPNDQIYELNEREVKKLREVVSKWLYTNGDGDSYTLAEIFRDSPELSPERQLEELNYTKSVEIAVILANHLASAVAAEESPNALGMFKGFFADMKVASVKPIEYIIRNAKSDRSKLEAFFSFSDIHDGNRHTTPQILEALEKLLMDIPEDARSPFPIEMQKFRTAALEGVKSILGGLAIDDAQAVEALLARVIKAKWQQDIGNDSPLNKTSLETALELLTELNSQNIALNLAAQINNNEIDPSTKLKQKFNGTVDDRVDSPMNRLKFYITNPEMHSELGAGFLQWFKERVDIVINYQAPEPQLRAALQELFPHRNIEDAVAFRNGLLADSTEESINIIGEENREYTSFLDAMLAATALPQDTFDKTDAASFADSPSYTKYTYFMRKAFAAQVAEDIKSNISSYPQLTSALIKRLGSHYMLEPLTYTVRTSLNSQKANAALAYIDGFEADDKERDQSIRTMLTLLKEPLAEDTSLDLMMRLVARSRNPEEAGRISRIMEELIDDKILKPKETQDLSRAIDDSDPANAIWLENIIHVLKRIKAAKANIEMGVFRQLENGQLGDIAAQRYISIMGRVDTKQ